MPYTKNTGFYFEVKYMKTIREDGTCDVSCDICGYKPKSCKDCRILHDPERMKGNYCSIECYHQSKEYKNGKNAVVIKKDII